MKCNKCGVENNSHNKFCNNCGNNLQETETPCQKCGATLTENAVYCPNCGAKKEELNREATVSPEVSSVVPTENTLESSQDENTANEEAPPLEAKDEHKPPTDFMNEEDNATSEEADVPPVIDKKKSKWIIAGVASLIAVIGVLFMFFKTDIFSTKNQATTGEMQVTKEQDNENLQFSIEQVSVDEYPIVKVKVAVQGVLDETGLSKDKWIISENGISHEVQAVNEIEAVSHKEDVEGKIPQTVVEIIYETIVVNSNPPSGEERTIELSYLDVKAISTYMSPTQSKLWVDNFSCNTDDYPDINCFFSLFDQSKNEVDFIQFDPKFIKASENGTPLENVSISKLADEEQYTSTNLVIDISGSMDEYNRIGQVKSAVNSFLNSVTMTDKNLVGVVSFANSEYIYQYPFTHEKRAIAEEVNSFETIGTCTALYEAINEAVFNASYNGRNGSKYVIAFTDGKDNCSDYVSSQTLVNNALQLGVPIYAVSVDHDPELQRIAEQTQGKYSNFGNDLARLNQFYREIFEDKKNQYVLSYKSAIPNKSPRNLQLGLVSPALYTDATTENITPKLLNDYAVADVMQKYQIAWSEAMNDHDVAPIVPYVTQHRPATDKQSVYNIVYDQIYGGMTSSGNRSGGLINVMSMYGEELYYHTPDYTLVDAEKVSDSHYRLRIQKRVQRDAYLLVNRNDPSLGFHPPLTTYKETAYTYNVINVNGTWLIDNVEDEAVPICYKDSTYTEKYQRSDGKTTQYNGNCPGMTMGER